MLCIYLQSTVASGLGTMLAQVEACHLPQGFFPILSFKINLLDYPWHPILPY